MDDLEQQTLEELKNIDNDFSDNILDKESIMDKHGSLFRELMNYDRYLVKKFLNWTGLTITKVKEEGEKIMTFGNDPHGHQIINIRGAKWLISILDTYARDNNATGWLDKNEYKWMNLDQPENILIVLTVRQKEFEIEDYGDIRRLWLEARDTITLGISYTGGGKGYQLFGEINYDEKADGKPEEKKKGIFGIKL